MLLSKRSASLFTDKLKNFLFHKDTLLKSLTVDTHYQEISRLLISAKSNIQFLGSNNESVNVLLFAKKISGPVYPRLAPVTPARIPVHQRRPYFPYLFSDPPFSPTSSSLFVYRYVASPPSSNFTSR